VASSPAAAPELSVVVPVYGCRQSLDELHRRVAATLDGAGISWELILVDDGSPDESWHEIERLAIADRRVRGLRLSRNFGQHAAITAGLAEALGGYAAVMDCDIQDPPEELPRLLELARSGYDVVLTERDERRQSLGRRIAGSTYLRLRNRLAGVDISPRHATLSVISRAVIDAFLRLGDRDRQYLMILHWLGFRQTTVEIRHAEREHGQSAYTFSKLVGVAADGMFFQTTKLLRWIVVLGFALAAAGIVLAGVYVGIYLTNNHHVQGYTSLAVLVLVVGGFTIVSTGVIGLYVGKIFEQVKGRPLYVVATRTEAAGAGEADAGAAVTATVPPRGPGRDR